LAATETSALLIRRGEALRVLVVDEEESTRDLCCEVASESGLVATAVATTEQAFKVIERQPVDIVVSDLHVPAVGGLALLKKLRLSHPHIAVIVLTQYGTMDRGVEAIRMGAADYLTKPFRIADLRVKINRTAHNLDIDRENRVMREELHTRRGFGEIIGTSPAMERIYNLIEKLGDQDCPVLILGESGTGKELVAKSIHQTGPRKDRPFVPVDCSALAPTLIESELFGHVRGAFTGAVQNKLGLLETANGGTAFLDEIGDLPLELQAKLLRALQNHEIRALGSTNPVSFDARIIAATNRDLEQAVDEGRFRQDLFFRLNVVQVNLPSLRQRKTDIALLAMTFLERSSNNNGRLKALSPDALALMMAYSWPGNVRELENAVECAIALSDGMIIETTDLPASLHYEYRSASTVDSLNIQELEKRAIFKALRDSGGSKIAAARALGMGKTTIYRKLKEYATNRQASDAERDSGRTIVLR